VFKKSIALAVPALAATALVAASLSGGAVQASSADQNEKPVFAKSAKAAKAVVLSSCTGGAQKKAADRGIVGYVYAQDNNLFTNLTGSTVKFRGPNHGKDIISVNFSAGTYLDSGEYGRIKVLLDGIPMKPSDNVDGSWLYHTGYSDVSRNFCGKIGKGVHTLRVQYAGYDWDGSTDYFYLYDPMLHAEQSN